MKYGIITIGMILILMAIAINNAPQKYLCLKWIKSTPSIKAYNKKMVIWFKWKHSETNTNELRKIQAWNSFFCLIEKFDKSRYLSLIMTQIRYMKKKLNNFQISIGIRSLMLTNSERNNANNGL